MLEVIFDNIEGNISSSSINLCNYIAGCNKDELVSVASDSGLTFLVQCMLLKL